MARILDLGAVGDSGCAGTGAADKVGAAVAIPIDTQKILELAG